MSGRIVISPDGVSITGPVQISGNNKTMATIIERDTTPHAKKVLIVGPAKSGKTTFLMNFIKNMPPYAGLMIGDDVLVDLKHWSDKNISVVCAIQNIEIASDILSYVELLYSSDNGHFNLTEL